MSKPTGTTLFVLAIAACATLLLTATTSPAANWINGGVNYNYTEASNWDAAVPNGIDATVVFGPPGATPSDAVILDTDVTVGSVTITQGYWGGFPSKNWEDATNSETLTFQVSSGNATYDVIGLQNDTWPNAVHLKFAVTLASDLDLYSATSNVGGIQTSFNSLSGSGDLNLKTSTFNMTGSNAGFTGAVNLDAGTIMNVNGTFANASGATVASGATLDVNGTLGGGATVAAGGNLIVDGTLNGGLTASSGAAVTLNGTLSGTSLVDSGATFMVNGGTISGDITADGTFSIATDTTISSALVNDFTLGNDGIFQYTINTESYDNIIHPNPLEYATNGYATWDQSDFLSVTTLALGASPTIEVTLLGLAGTKPGQEFVLFEIANGLGDFSASFNAGSFEFLQGDATIFTEDPVIWLLVDAGPNNEDLIIFSLGAFRIPEPSTMGLYALGGFLIYLKRRKFFRDMV